MLKRIFFVLTITSGCAFVSFLVTLLVLSLFGKDLWWIWFVALGVVLASLLAWGAASFRLDAARYADGEEAIGVITEIVVDDSMGPDSNPSYHLTIAAELAGGESIRRAAREYPVTEPQPGHEVRFRHNTRDPDDLQDILFLEFVDPADKTSERER